MLIDAANDAGGRDNITVVLFRLEEVGAGAPAPQETAEHRAVAPSPAAPSRRAAAATATATAPVARIEPRPAAPRRPGAPPPPPPARAGRPDPRPLPRRLRGPRAPTTPRRPSTSSAPATTASSRVYRGLPYDLPAGLHLYSVNYESGAPVDELTPAQKQTVTEHTLRSKDDAQDLVKQLETGELAAR